MAERIQTIYRDTLLECTDEWSERGTDAVEAYYSFMRKVGENAYIYTTYLGTAITAGGFIRDPDLSFGQVVAANTDYALDVADELHRNGAINVHESLDAVALGKVKGWGQSDFLLFFFNIMLRPDMQSPELKSELERFMQSSAGFDLGILNNQKLQHDDRYPHYIKFARGYFNTVQNLATAPINNMIELSDRKLSLGGRAEEELARLSAIEISVPALISSTHNISQAQLDPGLAQQMLRLQSLGADIFADEDPARLGLQKIT